MDRRKQLVLEAIINYFIETALPVGSNLLKDDFDISPATIRNDMAFLEHEGLLSQPYTSAGRVPTEIGYRFYVDELIQPNNNRNKIESDFLKIKREYFKQKTNEMVYDTISILSKLTSNIAFATMPENNKTFYMGLANILRKPEFVSNISSASAVVEVLEDGFLSVLEKLKIDSTIRVFIGKENIIPQIKTCSMIATSYTNHGFNGVIGILGPMRMKYSFNKSALEFASKLLHD